MITTFVQVHISLKVNKDALKNINKEAIDGDRLRRANYL